MALDKWADDLLVNELKSLGLVRYVATEEQSNSFLAVNNSNP